ncbi:hypothetical protein GCM10007198_06610 [Microbacterium aerolatum]|uniref:Uncharacterized protein n=1 Tax=Microbacterium aerolatum TaxID=153731 RepID=A0A511AF66_9MICO|nr:hypothetical protein MAE01_18420 [Microbacterium aerolatum]GGB18770.1 hypothetical protein GCM10007198_06610 [Microbacterium aerolatum]
MAHVDLNDRLRETRARLDRQRASAGQPRAKYARLERKEARVREDQCAELTSLARSLMRDRVSRRERITENTLIRVAIDLLLAHRDQLRGSDEGELRRSMMPEVPDFRSSAVAESGTSGVPDSRTTDSPDFRSSGVANSLTFGPRNYERPEPTESRRGRRS